jgi:hypothetical protein
MKDTLIALIAQTCDWHKTVNDAYLDECESRLHKLQEMLPSGSGIDCGCEIDVANSSSKKVVITFSFHHMNEDGYYDGWTDHKLIVTPRLWPAFSLRITGEDLDIKDYLYDLFDSVLRERVEL